MSKSTQLSVTTVLAVFLLPGLCFGGVITVDAGATGNNDGSSWPDAYRQLQSGLAVASSGDEIRVAQGLYKPAGVFGDRAATFQLLNGVTVQGGYAGLSAPDPNIRDIDVYETILSGDLNGDDDANIADSNSENSYNVVTGSGTDVSAVLDGFTITQGCANGNDRSDFKVRGGGMYNVSGSPTVKSCKFIENYASKMGGGMFNFKGSSPTITNCTFVRNRSEKGGGMRNYLNCNPIITDCDFIENSASSEGGGLYNRKNSNAVITNCKFIGNTAPSGGGMDNYVGKATSTGEPVIINCLFINNEATLGGGMRNSDPNSIVINCTFSNNTGSGMANIKGSVPIISNCIFWDNTGGSFEGPDNPTVTYSNVQGGYSGIGNINADPRFVQLGYQDTSGDWVGGDFHLLPDSPCIDSGDPAFVYHPDETDFDGQPRVINGRIDMGVYEFINAVDNNSPTPDPMTWQTMPYATGSASIAMAAATASDVSGVEYYFLCTSGGGYDSGWQDSAVYEAAGLQPNTQYTFSVQARDKSVNQNVTAWSTDESATTDAPDNDPPTPDPMTWETAPYATGSASIAMVAVTASDASGVEYYFVCTCGGGYDSGWQDSTMYEDTGLDPNTQYCYQVKARDKSANSNETAYSMAKSATTDVGCTVNTTYVESIVCGTFRGSHGNKYGKVTVTIYNNCGEPVSGAEVAGTFTGDYSEQLTEMTNSNGVAVITTSTQVKKPLYIFCVDNVTHESLTYNPNDNIETCKSN